MQPVTDPERPTAEKRPEAPRLDELFPRSPAAERLHRLAARVAKSDTSVLILGETGSGKDYLARALHREGPRSEGPFVAVNCGAVPESLLESELFGHEKGAFTGAVRERRGYFELAHLGTLFLDEIGEMSAHLQVKLLRALQDGEIQRLGGERPVLVDTRIIAATHRDLGAALDSGHFRRDLYYRLAVVTLRVPPLRERRSEIRELVEIYREKFAVRLARPEIEGTTPEALEALENYAWPGNVRELINVIERAVLLSEGNEIGVEDLPEEILAEPVTETGAETRAETGAASPAALDEWVEAWLERPLEEGRTALGVEFERRYLERQLARHRGHLGQTAKAAGIDPRTLYNKMRHFGLEKESFKA